MAEPFFAMDLIRFIARSARIEVKDMISTSKSHIHVRARSVAVKLLREKGFSFNRIGNLLNRDHTTILHSEQTFEAKYANDPMVAEMLDYARYEFDLEEKHNRLELAPQLSKMKVGDSFKIPAPNAALTKKIHRCVSQYGARHDLGFRGRMNYQTREIVIARVR